MAKTLYARLALGLFVLLAAVGLLYTFISGAAVRHYQETLNQQLNHDLARNLVADRNLVEEGQLNQAALKETFSLYMTINPSIEIYLLDPEGRILAYSADPGKIKRNSVSLTPIRRFLADAAEYPVLGDDPRSHDRRKVFSVTPVPSAEHPEGYLYVVLRGEEYDSAERMAREGHFLEMSGWAVAVSLAFGLVAGLVVFRLLTRRLERLAAQVERFEADGTEAVAYRPASAGSPDEIDRLGTAFESMSRRIQAQIEQLRDQDALRRRLVAQVSHDLRTPLASMRGYLESLQIKGEGLSGTERAEFLQIALDQGRRLSHLVDELFELASLEAREKEPHPEPFAPAELVHDVARKHEPAASEYGAAIAVEAAPGLPFARADLGMTERVLDNLIGNALRHSPEGGRVTVAAEAVGDRLRIKVLDEGPGIPEADLPHLFEAFYRGTAGETKGHAGLGLAIARRIMELQDGAISAANRTQGGAVFVLELPLHRPNVMET